MNRLLFAFLLACLVSSNAIPQNLTEEQRKILSSVENREHGTAVTALLDLERRDQKAFDTNNYDYLLARMAEANGDLAIAMANYQQVAGRGSVLRPYALAHLSQVARSTGNLLLERLYLLELSGSSPNALIAGGAKGRLAQNNYETANYSETIRIISGGENRPGSINSGGPKDQLPEAARRENLVLLGNANLRAGKTGQARDIFNTLITSLRDPAQPDDAAEYACLGLDLIDGGAENFGKKAPSISEDKHLSRANIYRYNRDFLNAKLHFEAVVENAITGPNAAESLFLIGRGFSQQSEYGEALKWYERVLEQFPDHPVAKDALLQAASAYSRVGKPKESINRYQKFIDRYPGDEMLDRAYLNIIDIDRDQGADNDALKWCTKTEEAFVGKLPATLALFAEARIRIARDEWQLALDDLERLEKTTDLGGMSAPGATNTAEIAFLKAFVFEQMQSYANAIDKYLSVSDGRDSYYGWLATERLKKLSENETAHSFVSQKVGLLMTGLGAKDANARRKDAQSVLRLTDADDLTEKAVASLKTAVRELPKYQEIPEFTVEDARSEARAADGSHQDIANKLLSLRLFDEAAPELDAAAPNKANGTNDAAYTLATLYTRGNRADRGIGFVEPLWRKVPADFPIELIPRGQLELLYPAPYADLLRKFAAERGVDPRFLLSIMRQESRFKPDAKSNAAARGLMQFIPATSNKIAGELGRDNYSRDELYNPSTAILFGSQYLADLFKLFPARSEAVAASYNAGEDNMARWLARSRSGSPERYVSEIMFPQSKDYVYKVLANYRMYKLLYNENLQLR